MGLNASQKQYFNEHLHELLTWLKIPSVYEKSDIYPYGKPIHDALVYIEQLAKSFGFETHMYKYGVVDIVWGKGEKFYIPCHVDVVEPGIGWEFDPFLGEVIDGRVYGRGCEDMKGGGWLVLSTMHYLKTMGYVPTYEFHLLFGSDEEREMQAMKQYAKSHPSPVFGFTPDGCFPLVTEEKGAAMIVIEDTIDSDICVKAGVQPNVVSPIVTCIEHNQTYTVKGKNAHASTPEKGIDATLLFLKKRKEAKLQALYNLFQTALFPNQTWIIGLLNVQNKKMTATIDIRYPFDTTFSDYIKRIQETFPTAKITVPYHDLPTKANDTSKEAKALIEAYTSVTHVPYQARVSGGVTYAKVIENVVSFGPIMDEEASLAHQKNESISLSALATAFEIYLRTFTNLGGKA